MKEGEGRGDEEGKITDAGEGGSSRKKGGSGRGSGEERGEKELEGRILGTSLGKRL